MRRGTTLAVAVGLGAAGVLAYWQLSRNPAAVPSAEAKEAERALPHIDAEGGSGRG